MPKLGLVDIRGYRNLINISGRIINATIEKETTNKYYVSIVVEEKEFFVAEEAKKEDVKIELI